jgi:hypothetical protein
MTDLSNVSSTELIIELQHRGFWTSFMYDPSDVEIALSFINECRDSDKCIVLSEDNKLDVLFKCFDENIYFDIDEVFTKFNTAIDHYILDNYDSKDYYKQ